MARRKGINSPLTYDERRKYDATIDAANRLRHWLCVVMEKYGKDDEGYSQAISVCRVATQLQDMMERFRKECL